MAGFRVLGFSFVSGVRKAAEFGGWLFVDRWKRTQACDSHSGGQGLGFGVLGSKLGLLQSLGF